MRRLILLGPAGARTLQLCDFLEMQLDRADRVCDEPLDAIDDARVFQRERLGWHGDVFDVLHV